ncbi:PspC domain-containing protein [Kaistella carnis]|uniref:PspC domain-containing protein n=1 Tax=Kaistella carnis TaxID=1241979 RepID=UPI00289C4491|nr:PspC domain-containing protein [Kaistella carnis]
MNKTLSIGLAGFSFTIEEHAYIKLSDYLAALRSSLDVSEADEVMHDIEIRMVEIFKDALGKREVINDTDVERVIAQIGSPEKIEEQEEAYFSEKTSNNKKEQRSSTNFNGQKQLFRDPERAKLAGVCAGLAHYVGMDITAMRAIWLGAAIIGMFTAISTIIVALIYIILWIVLPRAETATDFLKMKGKPMNFDNLKEESTKIVQFANESTQKVGELYNENKPYIDRAGNGLWNIIRYVLGGIFALMAVGCVIAVFAAFRLIGNPDLIGLNEFNFYFNEVGTSNAMLGMVLLLTLIPALLLTLLSIKLFSPKTKFRNIGYVIGGLIILLIGFISYFAFNMTEQDMLFRGHKEDIENIDINTTSDSLYVDMKQVTIPQNFIAYDDDIFSDKKMVFEEDYPSIDVSRKSNITTPYLVIKKEGKGYNIPVQLNVPVEIQGNKILLPNFMKYPYDHRFRDYRVSYELVVPQKTQIFKVRDSVLRIEDDVAGDDINDNDDDVNIKIGNNSIVANSETKDSMIVNGKKVSKEVGSRMIDSMDVDLKDLKDVNISIKNGKKEISIKTK